MSRGGKGYGILVDPDAAQPWETDTITCFHCQTVVFCHGRPPKTGNAVLDAKPLPLNHGMCLKCMRRICGPCADKGRCTPWEKQLERAEARARTRKSLGL